MRSSTSASEGEWKVILLVLAVLAGVEAFLRATETRLSLDLIHIQAIPKIAADLDRQPHPRVMFLGNSLTRDGINEDVFKRELLAQGVGPISLRRVFPDNTQIREWYYAFRRFFVNRSHLPDYLILSCHPTSLEDHATFSIYEVARHWADSSDVREVFRADVTVFGDQVEFLLSRFSVAFANRPRISNRVLHAVVPGYGQLARRINTTRNEMRRREMASGEHFELTYKRLARFAQLARDHHVRLILVAMPAGAPYTVDPGLIEAARASGVTFLDLHDAPGLPPERYSDGTHLDPQGAEIYSRYLARNLAPVFRRGSSSPRQPTPGP